MGEKTATNEVISKLMLLIKSNKNLFDAKNAIGNILSSFAVIRQLAPNIISDLVLSEYESYWLKNVSKDQLIAFFLRTENADWLPTVTQFALMKGVALTATDDEIVVYGEKELLKLHFSSLEFHQQVVKAFTDQGKQLCLYFAIPSETEKKSEESSHTYNIFVILLGIVTRIIIFCFCIIYLIKE